MFKDATQKAWGKDDPHHDMSQEENVWLTLVFFQFIVSVVVLVLKKTMLFKSL